MTKLLDDLAPCPFCGNAKVEIHHNVQAAITFMLCGDDQGRGGCGAVVSFRPNLTGSKAIQAYNQRAHAAEIERNARDAERYRWLCEKGIDDNGWDITEWVDAENKRVHLFKDQIDQAIDTDMSEGGSHE